MLDFLIVATRNARKNEIEIYPKFKIIKSKDLMVKGRDFYAIYNEHTGFWSTDEETAIKLIDEALEAALTEKRKTYDGAIKVLWMWDSESGSIEKFHKYCQKHMRDWYKEIDETLIFSDVKVKREDYASKQLPYSMNKEPCPNWDELVGTLYSPSERMKIEWAIGAIISGDSKEIQKFLVFYGEGGTGKSTIINVIEQLFTGYWAAFDAKALGSNNGTFALEPFKANPLVAIQHDGDLSKIEDNTRLNSIISHEVMTVNEKFKSTYSSKFNAFLFMGTNKPVKITDSKSGLIRRLIDVTPTGNKIPKRRYNELVKSVKFELGSIASRCLSVYLKDPGLYDDYIPSNMLGYSNDFYNFVLDEYELLSRDEGIALDAVYAIYLEYCKDSNINYPLSKRYFKTEMAVYYETYEPRYKGGKGYFIGFKKNKFKYQRQTPEPVVEETWIDLREQESVFDKVMGECFAQYADLKEKPFKQWSEVTTKLKELDTKKLHYVLLPLHHIIIDFDIKDAEGKKDFGANLREASKWPKTYAEVSKSGGGIHLHYFYAGEPERLERMYAKDIEIKVFTGKSSLRRKLSLCNNEQIATISSGLPVKEVKETVTFSSIKDDMHLRSLIGKALNKEVHAGTKPSMDFIKKILDEAYDSGMSYNVENMRQQIFTFAMNSTHQSKYCLDLISDMHFKSDDIANEEEAACGDKIVIFDVEVFPNLFVIVCKALDEEPEIYINPSKETVLAIIKYGKLVGFNNKRYDNHILYAAMMGYSNFELYTLSRKIIDGSKNACFGNAYNLSYTDIYDFAATKQSLKKWEVELGIHHQELGLAWDEPVDESMWEKVAEYCVNDVVATEALFKHLSSDFQARLILAEVAGMSPNTSTNSLTAKIIFGDDRNPQMEFNYRDLSKPVKWSADLARRFGDDYIFRIFDDKGRPTYQSYVPGDPLPDGYSVLPFFPGYTYEAGVSTYLGEKVGEGGRVYVKEGVYGDVGLSDVASMHPHSALAEVLFGPRYTKRFRDIVNLRIAIKHKDFETAKGLLGGAFAKHIDEGVSPKDLAYALKIAINSVYGMTSAKFDNKFRDMRNVDNIVAKRGALFMSNLKVEIEKRGYQVAHIKTDSVKVPDATKEIIDFIYNYGKEFGYTFEHEATYEKLCLINKADYIAKYKNCEDCERMYGYIPSDNYGHDGKWTATGKQFAIPYVFKTLFSGEGINFKDLCVTNEVKTALYLDFNEKILMDYLAEIGYGGTVSRILDIDAVVSAMKELKIASKKDSAVILEDPKFHDYHFVGRVGSFVPIKMGSGGGLLMRINSDGIHYGSATGTIGYRWMESEDVIAKNYYDHIDMGYFEDLLAKAKGEIEKYCDSSWFCSDDPYIPEMIPYVRTEGTT